MKWNKWNVALLWALALVPLVLVGAFYGRLPDQVPLHWGFDGEINGYGGKGELFLLAALGPGMALLFQILPRLDPKRRSYQRFQKYYVATALVIEAFMAVIVGVMLAEILRPGTLSIGRVISVLVGLLFMFLGNLMGKVKPNFFMGIRTPWTISDPDVWNRTHRLGGGLFFLAGLATAASAVLLPERAVFWVVLGGARAAAPGPIAVSYLWYRKKSAGTP